MKLSKSDLKLVVKECLIEILNEGLGGIGAGTLSGNFDPLINQRNKQQNTPRAFSESFRGQSVPQRKPSAQLHEAIKKEAGGNKIMEMILADTAASTLPKMLDNERPGMPMSQPKPGGLVEQVVASATPEDLFGEEAASKWADLAFMGTSIKK